MKKILIVDDSAFMRNILKVLLSEAENTEIHYPLELYEADGKVAALKKVSEIKPDLILLDIVMRESETEGLEFLKEIEGKFDPSHIIMVSSIGQTSVLNECKKFGVNHYLQKPFEHNEVITTVIKALA